MKTRPDLAAYALAALCVLVAGALGALHVAVPEFVPFIGLTAMGAGAGVSYGGGASSTPPPAAAAAVPPARASAEPVTGVFSRIAP